MEKFLNKKVSIDTCFGGYNGSGMSYKGIVTSYDDEFICLDENTYISRKFVLSILLK